MEGALDEWDYSHPRACKLTWFENFAFLEFQTVIERSGHNGLLWELFSPALEKVNVKDRLADTRRSRDSDVVLFQINGTCTLPEITYSIVIRLIGFPEVECFFVYANDIGNAVSIDATDSPIWIVLKIKLNQTSTN